MMSNQQQRVRKTVSPGATTKQGPIRATVPLSMMHQSPTKCSPSKSPPANWSAVKTRLSPDNRISPETHVASTGCRVEKSGPFIRRTSSVDTLYLLGQWQREALYLSYCGRLMVDRATQTPDELDEPERKLMQKRCASTCGDALEMKFIRQRLQRSGHSPRLMPSPSARQSPLPGDHSVISSGAQPSNNTSPQGTSSQALPIPIPDIPKPLIPRMRSSVEGLNQEIERIVLKQVAYFDGEDAFQARECTPEGHRAPIADLFRSSSNAVVQSVDTQTPFDSSEGYLSSSSGDSPAIILGHMDTSRPSSNDSPDIESTNKLAISPHINKFLTREPPDGCEKVTIEETRNLAGPEISSKPSVNFVLLPSRRSAFYPLCKNCGISAPNGDIVRSSPVMERF